jgi:hypothetical protein
MSSPKAVAGAARAAKAAAKPVVSAETDLSVLAKRLAGDIERALGQGQADCLTPEALQDLMAAVCKTYTAQIEAGQQHLPLRGRTTVSSTDIMTVTSGLLKAANLAVFELGMWQSWTGR